jgi:hypothetical protein
MYGKITTTKQITDNTKATKPIIMLFLMFFHYFQVFFL